MAIQLRPICVHVKIATADTEQEIYKAMDLSLARIFRVRVVNGEATAKTCRISVDPNDDNTVEATIADAEYWDASIPANDSFSVCDIIMAPGASLNVRTSHANMAVSVAGVEFA